VTVAIFRYFRDDTCYLISAEKHECAYI